MATRKVNAAGDGDVGASVATVIAGVVKQIGNGPVNHVSDDSLVDFRTLLLKSMSNTDALVAARWTVNRSVGFHAASHSMSKGFASQWQFCVPIDLDDVLSLFQELNGLTNKTGRRADGAAASAVLAAYWLLMHDDTADPVMELACVSRCFGWAVVAATAGGRHGELHLQIADMLKAIAQSRLEESCDDSVTQE